VTIGASAHPARPSRHLGQEKDGRAAAYPNLITVASHTKKGNPAGLPSRPSSPQTTLARRYVLITKVAGQLAIARRLSGARPVTQLGKFAPSFQLDVAYAHALLRHDDQAVATLRQLRDDRPQWFPRQRYAADILAAIIGHRRTLSAEIRELADAANVPL
jgi:hypothetical protein